MVISADLCLTIELYLFFSFFFFGGTRGYLGRATGVMPFHASDRRETHKLQTGPRVYLRIMDTARETAPAAVRASLIPVVNNFTIY